MKLIVIGSHLCEDTRNALKVLEERKIEVEFFNISENLEALKKYLAYRESESLYDEVRKNGGIGIPLIIMENGYKSFDLDEVLRKIEK